MPARTHTSSPYRALSGDAGVIPMSLHTLKSTPSWLQRSLWDRCAVSLWKVIHTPSPAPFPPEAARAEMLFFGTCIRPHALANLGLKDAQDTSQPIHLQPCSSVPCHCWLDSHNFSEWKGVRVEYQTQEQLCWHKKSVEWHFHQEGISDGKQQEQQVKKWEGASVKTKQSQRKEERMKKMLKQDQKKDWPGFLISSCC